MWWIIFALISAIGAALVAIFGKIGLKDVDSTLATAIRAGVMFGLLFIAVLATKKLPELSNITAKGYLWIVMAAIAGALSWFFYFLALKFGPASKVVALDRLSIVFVVILAALFLAEKITWPIAIGAVLMTIGAILIAL